MPAVGLVSLPNHNPRHLEAVRLAAADQGRAGTVLVDVYEACARARAHEVAGVRV